jgi:hypothetical protein
LKRQDILPSHCMTIKQVGFLLMYRLWAQSPSFILMILHYVTGWVDTRVLT